MTLLGSLVFSGVQDVLTEAQFNSMFPNRNAGSCGASGAASVYTFSNLVTAAAMFPEFLNEGSLSSKKRELAAFLGQVAHETTGGGGTWCGGVTNPNSKCFNWGLCYTEEVDCNNNSCSDYNDSGNQTYPTVAGKTYHGRGAMQLSWNYNYGPASEQMYGDKMYLLNNPDLVKTSAWAFRTAIWFWMDATSSRPSPHHIITRAATGDSRALTFGAVTNAINGGMECTQANSIRINKQHDRVNFFKRFAGVLGVNAKPNSYTGTNESYFYCTNQSTFAQSPWTGQNLPTNILPLGQSSSSNASSSSSPGSSSSGTNSDTCQRTLITGYEYNFQQGKSFLAGHQTNNYTSQGGVFDPGDLVIPAGEDCDLALTLGSPSDTWNLYTSSAWTGQNINKIRLEKVVFISSSSSQLSSSLSSSAVSSSSFQSSSSSLNQAPVMQRDSISVPENAALQTTLWNLDSLCSDTDSKSYTVLKPGEPFAIKGSELSIASALDFENIKLYFFAVECSDGSLKDTANLVVSVEDVFEDGYVTADSAKTQNISLSVGWNLISLQVAPSLNSANQVFQALTSLEVVKDVSGNSYIPSENIDQISPISPNKGYRVYVSNTEVLSVSGLEVKEDLSHKILAMGWHYIPFWTVQSLPIATALTSVLANVEIAKNASGEVYLPAYNVEQIGTITPGMSLMIYLQSPDTLHFRP